MALDSYDYQKEEKDIQIICKQLNEVNQIFQDKLMDLEMDCYVLNIDVFACNKIEELESKIKDRFYFINQNEYMIGSSIEKEKKDIENLHITYKEISDKFENIFFKLYVKDCPKENYMELVKTSYFFKDKILACFDEPIHKTNIYTLKGVQNKDYPHAYDYVDVPLHYYAVILNDKYCVLFASGTEE